jgi:4-amino-4-deoxy-L-arabinose transferase-like glycosyltransferase
VSRPDRWWRDAGFPSVWVLVALSAPIIFWGLGGYSVANNDEAYYHSVARTMVDTGNWLRLEFTGEHRLYDTFMNAPLHYWVKAALIASFGDSLWTMRVLSALFGLFAVLMTYRLTAYLSSDRAGFLAALLLLTNFQFVYWHSARTGETEAILCFLFAASAYRFLLSLDTGRGFILHHACLIVIFSLKSPLVMVPVATELAFFALSPPARAHFARWAGTAVAMLPVALAWHVPNGWVHSEEVAGIVRKMASQAAGTLGVFTRAAQNLQFYGIAVVFGAFPYAFAFPLALASAVARLSSPGYRQRWLLLLLHPAFLLLWFALVAKRSPYYIIPIYPFLCAFLGDWLSRLPRRPLAPGAVFGLALAAVLTVWVGVEAADPNPFAVPAGKWQLALFSRSFSSLGPWLEMGLASALLAAGLYALRARCSQRWTQGLLVGLAAVLIGVGTLRVLRPLQFTRYTSEMEEVARELAAKRARGDAIDYPVALAAGKGSPFIVRYYFGDEMIIARSTTEARLDSEGNPVVFYLFDKTRGVAGIRGEDLLLFPPYDTR